MDPHNPNHPDGGDPNSGKRGGGLKSAMSGIHGAGEVLRGTINQATASVLRDDAERAKNQAVIDNGLRKIDASSNRSGATAVPASTSSTVPGSQYPTSSNTTGLPGSASSTVPGSHHPTSGTPAGYGATNAGLNTHPTATSSTGQHGASYGGGTNSSNYGPHDSNLGNKVDPRYDSDLDHRGTAAGQAHPTTSSNYGPHSSNAANKMDPTVDSDLDHRGPTQAPGHGPQSSTHGPHSKDTLNKADPRVDSDFDQRGPTGSHGQPVASSNYGPHSSNVGNKADPRVDSDR
ncbi:MAG: hypothetical protein M1833_002147, partial [Piccolia ochrophora]